MIKYLAILILTCACSMSSAQVNIITTIAGIGTAGYSGDGGSASVAALNRPYAIVLKGNETLFFVDAFNHAIRKISFATGIIAAIAGDGTSGYSGDGGAATSARLFVPQGLCKDNAGNLYISDGLNHCIRRVDGATQVITTIAGKGTAGFSGDGGIATNAELNMPVGICVDKFNNLYIVDLLNERIRKVRLDDGIISTVAGNGTAGYSGDGGPSTNSVLNSPADLFADNDGNLFLSDVKNSVVRRIEYTTGVISTVAGNGSTGYSGDGGLAKSAQFNEPAGLFIDKDNNLFVADYRNGAIRKISAATGIVTTVAGGAAGYSGDGGPATAAKLKCTDVAVDDYGNIYIADYVNDRIRKVSSGVAVNGIDKDAESRLYPNPTNGTFSVQTPAAISLVSIYNIGGVLVHQQTCIAAETQVDITAQPPGAYMVYVRCGDKMYVSKVVRN